MVKRDAPSAAHVRTQGDRWPRGVRQDGSVICPWHKARFWLHSGALLDPPAADALPSAWPNSMGAQRHLAMLG
jgi:nitrite reductase/ring-hydroxylating ferredoxin subunit